MQILQKNSYQVQLHQNDSVYLHILEFLLVFAKHFEKMFLKQNYFFGGVFG